MWCKYHSAFFFFIPCGLSPRHSNHLLLLQLLCQILEGIVVQQSKRSPTLSRLPRRTHCIYQFPDRWINCIKQNTTHEVVIGSSLNGNVGFFMAGQWCILHAVEKKNKKERKKEVWLNKIQRRLNIFDIADFRIQQLVRGLTEQSTVCLCAHACVCGLTVYLCACIPNQQARPQGRTPWEVGCRCCWRSQKRAAPTKIKPQEAEAEAFCVAGSH